jgi:hypothetical protein
MGGSCAANACGMLLPTLGHARYTQDSRSARGFTCAGELSRGVGLRGFEIGLKKRADECPTPRTTNETTAFLSNSRLRRRRDQLRFVGSLLFLTVERESESDPRYSRSSRARAWSSPD